MDMDGLTRHAIRLGKACNAFSESETSIDGLYLFLRQRREKEHSSRRVIVSPLAPSQKRCLHPYFSPMPQKIGVQKTFVVQRNTGFLPNSPIFLRGIWYVNGLCFPLDWSIQYRSSNYCLKILGCWGQVERTLSRRWYWPVLFSPIFLADWGEWEEKEMEWGVSTPAPDTSQRMPLSFL